MKAENVKVNFSYTCPDTGNVVQEAVSFNELEHNHFTSMYEDCGTGYGIDYRTYDCKECHGRHVIEVFEDRPYGG